MNDWIEWHGGECPVPNDTVVEARFRNGIECCADRALVGFDWGHKNTPSDIVAYRFYRLDEPAQPCNNPRSPAMDEQKERAAFEAWCQSIGFTTWRNTEGDYFTRYGAELWSGWQARAALAAAPAPVPQWQPIETAPKEGATIFVVRAFGVSNGFTGGREYTSDPYCVWRTEDGGFERWPHHFSPTHWMPFPAAPDAARAQALKGE